MILCVEDDIDSREVVTKLIESSGMPCVVRSAHNTDDAIRLIAKERFDLYVLDTWMPEIGGLRLSRMIREIDPATSIVFFTEIDSNANRKKALAAGATEFLAKPYDIGVGAHDKAAAGRRRTGFCHLRVISVTNAFSNFAVNLQSRPSVSEILF